MRPFKLSAILAAVAALAVAPAAHAAFSNTFPAASTGLSPFAATTPADGLAGTTVAGTDQSGKAYVVEAKGTTAMWRQGLMNSNALPASRKWCGTSAVTLLGSASAGSKSFSGNSSNEKLSVNSHGYQNGDVVVLSGLSSNSAGLTAGVPYFVVSKATNDFMVSTTSGGGAVDITASVTGTVTRDSSLTTVDPAYIWGRPLKKRSGGVANYCPATGMGTDKSPTGSASTDTFTLTGHGLKNRDPVVFSSITGGGTPAGATAPAFVANAHYFVVNKTDNTFQLALTPGGTLVDFTADVTVATMHRTPKLSKSLRFSFGTAAFKNVLPYAQTQPTALSTGNTFLYLVKNDTGSAANLRLAMFDQTTGDNAGTLQFRVRRLTTAECGSNGWQKFNHSYRSSNATNDAFQSQNDCQTWGF
jgi:hypothetical protein